VGEIRARKGGIRDLLCDPQRYPNSIFASGDDWAILEHDEK
jgi:hypothetical protein